MLSVSLSLWILAAIFNVIAAVMARRSETTPRFFKAYLYFTAVASPCALLIYRYMSNMAYFQAFYAIAIIADLLTFLVAYELYYEVFGPAAALPRLVPQRAGALVAMAFSGAAALAVFIPPVLGGTLTRSMLRTEQIMTTGAWGAFFVLVSYSLILRIAWPRRAAGLALGFVLYLNIDVFAVFARARGGYQVAAIAGTVGQTAYWLALVWWTCVFWQKEPAPTTITPEQVAIMKRYHPRSIAALARSGAQK